MMYIKLFAVLSLFVLVLACGEPGPPTLVPLPSLVPGSIQFVPEQDPDVQATQVAQWILPRAPASPAALVAATPVPPSTRVVVPDPDFPLPGLTVTREPTMEPTMEPVMEPVMDPTAGPAVESTVEPAVEPLLPATEEPSATEEPVSSTAVPDPPVVDPVLNSVLARLVVPDGMAASSDPVVGSIEVYSLVGAARAVFRSVVAEGISDLSDLVSDESWAAEDVSVDLLEEVTVTRSGVEVVRFLYRSTPAAESMGCVEQVERSGWLEDGVAHLWTFSICEGGSVVEEEDLSRLEMLAASVMHEVDDPASPTLLLYLP